MARILPEGWALPEVLRARMGTSAGRQRAMIEEGHVLLVLHQPPRASERDRRALVLWRDREGEWRASHGPSGPASIRAHLESYAQRLAELERRIASATTARDRFEVLRDARPLARAARNMHAALQDVRTAIPADTHVLVARDRAYELERETSDVLEEASAAMQLGLAERAEEQAATAGRIAHESHRLNLLAAVCMPITALGAMLGMNVQTGLEHLPGPGLFFAIVASCFGIGLGIHAWIRRAPGPERATPAAEPTARRLTSARAR